MAFTTGGKLDFNTLGIALDTVPVYRLGVQGNKKDPVEEEAVKAAFDLLAKTCFISYGPGPRKTLIVSLYEPPEGPAEIAGQNG